MEGNTWQSVSWLLLILCPLLVWIEHSEAAVIETSAMLSYSKSTISDTASSRQNRYTASIAFRFTKISAVELSYSVAHTKLSQQLNFTDSILFSTISQSTMVDDQVISISWIQNILPAKYIIQPYFKIGAGKLRRRQKVEFSALLSTQEQTQKSETGVVGLGIRIFLTKHMALKGEFVTYVPKFQFSKWKESQHFSAGLSWLF